MVFSLSAQQEVARKAIFGPEQRENSNRLFHRLIKHTASVAKDSGIDLVWIDEHQQQGDSFGERYANAFQKLFDQGYDQVISIGNDCPELTADILRKAQDILASDTLVLGPVVDGGVYLVGLSKEAFAFDEFRSLPWNSAQLFDSLKRYGQSHRSLRLHCLELLADIDDYLSLLLYLSLFSTSSFTRFLLCLLTEPGVAYALHSQVATSAASMGVTNPLRAPPLPSSFAFLK